MITRLTQLLLLLQLGLALVLAIASQRAWPGLSEVSATLIGMSVIVAVRALIVANNFRLAARFPCDPPAPRLGCRRAATLYLGELRATLISSSVNMPFRRFASVPTNFSSGIPVLLIHGYGCNSGYWWPLCRHLQSARMSYHAVNLEPVLADIDDYLPMVNEAIGVLCAATRQRQVIIVAHSMGGLVARAWMRTHGTHRVAKLITLGSPHDGTGLAQFAFGENSRQMRRNGTTGTTKNASSSCNGWLRALQADENLEQLPVVSIYSLHDNIVAPQSTSRLAGAKNIAFDGIGHVALGSHPAVIACVLEQICETSNAPAQAAMSIHSKPSC